jgi:hypothetical protein
LVWSRPFLNLDVENVFKRHKHHKPQTKKGATNDN